jgi:hypothetical protein
MSKIKNIQDARLLKYKIKNEMMPTFVSGIFLSGAMNILTTSTFRDNFFEMLSMILMFISCGLFFWEASKIREFQTWYNSLPDVNKTDKCFLENTTRWDFGNCKNFYKKVILLIPICAWLTGVLSLLLYLFSLYVEKIISTLVNSL